VSGNVLPRCEQCNQILSCETDWIGRMHYVHDRPCVPVRARRYRVECAGCGKGIEIEVRPRSDREYSCGERCTRAISARRQAKKRADVFARWLNTDDPEQQRGAA
jgi:hypothetical protein